MSGFYCKKTDSYLRLGNCYRTQIRTVCKVFSIFGNEAQEHFHAFANPIGRNGNVFSSGYPLVSASIENAFRTTWI